jgi:hypothetical protein
MPNKIETIAGMKETLILDVAVYEPRDLTNKLK